MRFASGASRALDAAEAVRELSGALDPQEWAGEADLALLFFTADHREAAARLGEAVSSTWQPRVMLGVSCESVIGGEVEIERQPGVSLLLARLPGVVLQPFHLAAAEWRELLENEERLQQRVGAGEAHRGQLLLADPFTTPVDPLLAALDGAFETPTFGGMASGSQAPGGNALLMNGELYRDGAIGAGIGGAVRLDTVVSQGCRPVGQPLVITREEQNLIMELGRRPALEVASEVLRGLSADEQRLVEQVGLFVGVVINEYQERFGRGDFLVRGLMGVDRESGGLLIGDFVRAGQTVQFHVRDAGTAHEDLTELLQPHTGDDPPAGALLFSCNGLGTRMFDEPHHDLRTTRSLVPGLPVAGFFAMGELGPVGGKSFIHGHTASLALFRPG